MTSTVKDTAQLTFSEYNSDTERSKQMLMLPLQRRSGQIKVCKVHIWHFLGTDFAKMP